MAKEGNDFNTSVGSLLKGLEQFVNSKTVMGEPVMVKDTVIIPLMDMKFGVGAGAFDGEKKNNTAGGLGATVNPCAVLIIQNGMTKVVNVKNQDLTSKVLDMVPDIVNRFTSKGEKEMDSEVEEKVDDILNPEKEKK